MRTAGTAMLLVGLLVAVGLAQPVWEPQTSGVTVTLRSVACVGGDMAWAVGDNGTILHTSDNGSTWETQTSGTNEDLYGVWFADPTMGWAVGDGPVILKTDNGGDNWNSQTPGTSSDLRAVTFPDPMRGWAAGVGGTIVGTEDGGDNWTEELTGESALFGGICAEAPDQAWAFGTDAINSVAPVYHFQGGLWNRQAEITGNQNGHGITIVGGMTLWAVADSGLIAVSNDGGGVWEEQISGTTAWLGGVHAPSPRECWAVGEGGMIRRTDDAGATWSLDTSESTSDLYAVRMIDDIHGRAVGADGRILYRTGGTGVAEGRAQAVRRPGATLVRDQLRLKLDVSGRVEVRLLDAAGRMARGLYSGPARPELELSLAGVPAGAYFVEVASPGRRDALRLVRLD